MDPRTLHELTAAYVLNALDEREAGEYEEHLARCEQCREELAALGRVTEALAYGSADAPPPPSQLRGRILGQARDERSKMIPMRSRWTLAAAGLAAAAACAAIALGAWAATLHGKLQHERAAQGNDAAALSVLTDSQGKRYDLQGARGELVVTRTGEGALGIQGLGPAPAGKTYEAWVIEHGKATSAALFHGGEDVIAIRLAPPVPLGAYVAVTREDANGRAPAPSGPAVFGAQT